MKKIFQLFLLNKEAYLYDARLYIMKSLVAVLAAYAIVQQLPLVHKDLISVLFGLMMTLEPVTITGIRSGFRQITATILGALITAIIVYIFGINIWTVALSISATLFLCLKINWREVSPVAIFTSIYMTNYVQYTANGEPSVILTFQLRILALGIGILIAVLFNFLFSLFFYKQMESKRIAHNLYNLSYQLKEIKKGVEEGSVNPFKDVKERLPETFHGIDWLTSLVRDKEKEAKLTKKFFNHNKYKHNVSYYNILNALRTLTHLVYDSTYYLIDHFNNLNNQQRDEINIKLDGLIKECEYLAAHCGNFISKYSDKVHYDQILNSQDLRIFDNLIQMEVMIDIINNTLFDME
jgi:uncharacterized membrane protein YgaE (UPF0421/DUF939 family)